MILKKRFVSTVLILIFLATRRSLTSSCFRKALSIVGFDSLRHLQIRVLDLWGDQADWVPILLDQAKHLTLDGLSESQGKLPAASPKLVGLLKYFGARQDPFLLYLCVVARVG